MADAVNADEIAGEIEDARAFFKSLKAGDRAWHSTAKAMSDHIVRTLNDVDKDFSVLDEEGKKNSKVMEEELNAATVKLQVADVRKSFELLKSGEISVSPQYMADYIHKDLKAVGKDLSTLDPKGKKTADEMEKELGEIITYQQVRIDQNLFKLLRAGDTDGYKGAAHMSDSIREDLKKVGKDLSFLYPKGKKTSEEMDVELKKIVASHEEKKQKLEKAVNLFRQLENDDEKVPYSNPEIIGKYIRVLVNSADKPLSALVDGEQSNFKVDERLKQAVDIEKERNVLAVKAVKQAASDGKIIIPFVDQKKISKVVEMR